MKTPANYLKTYRSHKLLNRYFFILTLFCALSWNQVNAQEVIIDLVCTSGGVDTAGLSGVSWSIGEVVAATQANSTKKVTQGFQQSYFCFTGVEKIGNTESKVTIFPNPFVETLTIDLTQSPSGTYSVNVTDLTGKVLKNVSCAGNGLSVLDMNGYAQGTYFVSVISKDKPLQSFKVVKTN